MTEKEIRDRITKLRMDRNLSENRLSTDLGQSISYIQSITSGRALPSLKALMNICEYFGVSMSEFFEERLPSASERTLRREIEELTDEDIEHLIYIARKMKYGNLSEEKK